MVIEDEVRKFFNSLADKWDSYWINDEGINIIIDSLNLNEDSEILDVATGTGVLIPYYLKKNIRHIDAIDLSDRMIEKCRQKYSDERVNFICGNIMNYEPEQKYDVVMLYNALPHMPDIDELVQKVSSLLKQGGAFVIAHGISLEKLTEVHDDLNTDVAAGFPDMNYLLDTLNTYLQVTEQFSNDNMFCLKSVKK